MVGSGPVFTATRRQTTYRCTDILLAGRIEHNSRYRRANLTPPLPKLDSDGRGRGQALEIIGHGPCSKFDGGCCSYCRALQAEKQEPEEVHG